MEANYVKPGDLFSNSLCSTLYQHIRPVYPVKTVAGKKARKIIVALQKICLEDPRCPRDLPVVSDCDSPPPAGSEAPDFLALFTGDARRTRIVSDDPTVGSSPPHHSTLMKAPPVPARGRRNWNIDT